MKTKWIEGMGSMLSQDDLNAVLQQRVDFLESEIEYLLSCNPKSTGLISPTENEYANGKIKAYENEINFLKKL